MCLLVNFYYFLSRFAMESVIEAIVTKLSVDIIYSLKIHVPVEWAGTAVPVRFIVSIVVVSNCFDFPIIKPIYLGNAE